MNDPVVRRASFCEHRITEQEHRDWLARVLADPERILWIIVTSNGARAGQVRFDCRGTAATISISLTPPFRGCGLGRGIIAQACDTLLRETDVATILAEIRRENTRSYNAFQRAGFVNVAERCTTDRWVLVKDGNEP